MRPGAPLLAPMANFTFSEILVGAAGFEPTTYSTQNYRATRLRYAPRGVPYREVCVRLQARKSTELAAYVFSAPAKVTEAIFERPPFGSARTADDLDIEIADLLAKRIAIDAQKLGSLDLIAPCGGERNRDQGIFHLPEDTMIETRWWQVVAKGSEIGRQMFFD